MSVVFYLRRACALPPKEVVARASALVRQKIGDRRRRRRDRIQPTFLTDRRRIEGSLARLLQMPSLDLIKQCGSHVRIGCKQAMEHRFDLLGSGPVQVFHGMQCEGLDGFGHPAGQTVSPDPKGQWLATRINAANLSESQRIWQLIDDGYRPIDWQIDFRSGYRWSELIWSSDIVYGHTRGVDVKVPWELSRSQHLPQLALGLVLAKGGEKDFGDPKQYIKAFRNQILDFVATNPPRYGVNWSCTMDVAIRVANWLTAYDLLLAAGAEFDEPFEKAFRRSVWEHGDHIIHHLEWAHDLRSNHYLANVVGLLFVAAFLPPSRETDAWLRFAVRELIQEVDNQFGHDGAGFEASTNYHRLSAQMVVYATTLVLALDMDRFASLWDVGLDDPVFRPGEPAPPLSHQQVDGRGRITPFSEGYLRCLSKMGEFTVALTRPDGLICQFGDNDSGYFLKLSIGNQGTHLNGEVDRGLERHLDHAHLVASLNGLIDGPEPERLFPGGEFERQIIRQAIGGKRIPVSEGASKDRHQVGRWQRFDSFGVYVYRTAGIYLAVRCGSIGQNNAGGHAHNDQLSFELCFGNEPIVVDPGTGVYTPLPDLRNRMRSTAMHNTLSVDGLEQNPWNAGAGGLFSLNHRSYGRLDELSETRFVGNHQGFEVDHCRSITIAERGIEVIDVCPIDRSKQICVHLDPSVKVIEQNGSRVTLNVGDVQAELSAQTGTWQISRYSYSPGYGQWVEAPVCVLPHRSASLRWALEMRGS